MSLKKINNKKILAKTTTKKENKAKRRVYKKNKTENVYWPIVASFQQRMF